MCGVFFQYQFCIFYFCSVFCLPFVEAAAAPAPKPEPVPEPFDNTTYRNLQHHDYNIYTFVDMDVEMAKHRLPQPSTGRPSPRD